MKCETSVMTTLKMWSENEWAKSGGGGVKNKKNREGCGWREEMK